MDDIRKVRMHRDIWDPESPLGGISIRDEAGRAITVEWGEPDAEGWWEPVFKVSGTTEAERTAAAVAAALSER